MQLNTDHINRYKSIVASYAESHRKVQPVINTCLNNITSSSENIDPQKVCLLIFFLSVFSDSITLS